jgi:hypothetical protein
VPISVHLKLSDGWDGLSSGEQFSSTVKPALVTTSIKQ